MDHRNDYLQVPVRYLVEQCVVAVLVWEVEGPQVLKLFEDLRVTWHALGQLRPNPLYFESKLRQISCH